MGISTSQLCKTGLHISEHTMRNFNSSKRGLAPGAAHPALLTSAATQGTQLSAAELSFLHTWNLNLSLTVPIQLPTRPTSKHWWWLTLRFWTYISYQTLIWIWN